MHAFKRKKKERTCIFTHMNALTVYFHRLKCETRHTFSSQASFEKCMTKNGGPNKEKEACHDCRTRCRVDANKGRLARQRPETDTQIAQCEILVTMTT